MASGAVLALIFTDFGGLDPQKVDSKAEVIPKVCARLSEGVSQAVGNRRKPAQTGGNQRNSAEIGSPRIGFPI